VSHWVLDWITHAPDLPLYPGGPRVGLGLWHSVAATMVIETLVFLAGLFIYTRTTRAADRTGRWPSGPSSPFWPWCTWRTHTARRPRARRP